MNDRGDYETQGGEVGGHRGEHRDEPSHAGGPAPVEEEHDYYETFSTRGSRRGRRGRAARAPEQPVEQRGGRRRADVEPAYVPAGAGDDGDGSYDDDLYDEEPR